MDLYLRVVDSKPVDHPVTKGNLEMLFPDHDFSTGGPADYVPFRRAEEPIAGPYERVEGSTYGLADGTWTDIWTVTPLTEEEKSAKIAAAKASWAEHGYASWTFDEVEFRFVPPVQPPDETKPYHWDETTKQWLEGPMPDPAES